jgi:signal transduction histidine kinase
LEIKNETFTVFELIEELADMHKSDAVAKNIDLKIIVDPKIRINTDKKILETVIRNLTYNAVKFTDHGGTVILKAIETDKNIEFSIIDNGVGIKSEDIQKLFRIDSYFSTPGTDNEKGSGLGLIICKEFVEKLKGNILVKSKFGEGTTFKFCIPISL